MLKRSERYPTSQANDVRQYGAAYCPPPSRTVDRAVRRLLTAPRPVRGKIAFWTIAALTGVLVAAGIRW